MAFFLNETIDFERHNEQTRQLWADYGERKHTRVPVRVTGSIRNLISNPAVNDTGWTFRDFFEKTGAQIDCQLAYQHYSRHHILCDNEMGLPESWGIGIDFQNSYDQAWFGCPLRYFGDTDVPDTEEILKDDPGRLYRWDDPDPVMGRGDFMKRAMEMYEHMHRRREAGLEFQGLPVNPPKGLPGAGSDGVFSIACKLRGTVETMVDMLERPDYFHALMDYVTRNQIARIKAVREWGWDHDPDYTGDRNHRGSYGYADDAIAMLSCDQYKAFVLPYHRRFFEAFHDGSASFIHLCGDATHHFKFLADAFNVQSFDTGFPVDHGWLRKALGPDITINGGPTVMLLKDGTPDQVAAETKRICKSGVMDGKRFILIAANNLAPCTPVENIQALYEAAKTYGRYDA